jgi:hypothetical protein
MDQGSKMMKASGPARRLELSFAGSHPPRSRSSAICGALFVMLAGLSSLSARGQTMNHYFQDARMPPGAVGAAQIWRQIPGAGTWQPVRLFGPGTMLISVAEDGRFSTAEAGQLNVALLVGQVYRLRISNIPQYEDFEVYPSLEIINRVYPPAGQHWRFAVPIELAREDLELAIQGQLVTRVIYLEDPRAALPAAQDLQRQRYFDVPPHEDPLHAADRLGRPMAILRMGSRVPDFDPATGQFLFHSPPFLKHVPGPEREVPAASDARLPGLEPGSAGQLIPRLPLGEPSAARPPYSARRQP